MLLWWISCMVGNGEILWKLSVSVMVNIHNRTATFHLEQIFTPCPLTPKFRFNSTFSRQGLTWGLKKVSSILFQSGNEEKTLVIPEYYRLLSYYQPPKQTSACRSEKEVMDVLNSAEVAELWKVFGPRIGLVGGRALTVKKPKDLLVGCADTKSQALGSKNGWAGVW